MTSSEAYGIAQGYTRIAMTAIYVFTMLCVGFVVWIVNSTDLHETESYDDLRKLLALVFSIFAVPLMLAAVKLLARSNAAVRLAGELFNSEHSESDTRLFRPVSPMFAFFAMTVAVIAVNYIILIYAVDGGLF